MDREATMLPTPAELRERAQRYREAAQRAANAKTKRQLAVFAFALARVAAALERGAEIPSAKLVQYRRLVEVAMGDRTERVVKALTGGERTNEEQRRQIEAWRLRAEELRAIADQFVIPSVVDALRQLADNYDALANDCEARMAKHSSAANDKAG
jgi:hypothetical protein